MDRPVADQLHDRPRGLLLALGILSVGLTLALSPPARAQCANDNSYLTTATPPATDIGVAPVSYPYFAAGRYVTMAVCLGTQYTFTTCGYASWDTQITLYNNAGGAAVGYNDDSCGLQSTVTWTATFSGTLRVLLDQYSCSNSGAYATVRITQTTRDCTGSACYNNRCNAGVCSSYEPRTCEDNNACTVNACDSVKGCCNVPYACNDGLTCTTDSCNGTGGCNYAVVGGWCRIGGACYANGTQNPANQCQICNSTANANGWSNKSTGTACNDGNACSYSDVCSSGSCAGTAYGCNDGLTCTTDTCNGSGGCTYAPNAGFCAISGACYANGAQNPGNQCQTCVSTTSQTGWTNKTTGTACNDGNACSHTDVCSSGTCAGTGYSCNDGLSCTTDTCNGSGGCSYPVAAGNCLIAGTCRTNGTQNPANQCQTCVSTTSQSAWTSKTNGTACSDGTACTGPDTCQTGTCSTPAITCNDGNTCTDDSCNASTGCVYAPNSVTYGTCTTGMPGQCGAGRYQCQEGTPYCVPTVAGFGQASTVAVPSGLLSRSTGVVGSDWKVITSDGRWLYSGAYGRDGGSYNGYTIRQYDPKAGNSLVLERKVGASSFYMDGMVADSTYVYPIEWTGGLGRVWRVQWSNGALFTDSDTRLVPQAGAVGLINGQYDWVRDKVWMGGLSSGFVARYGHSTLWAPTASSSTVGSWESTFTGAGIAGAGVVASDGTYLYLQRWSSYPGDNVLRRIGTGYGGTTAGASYGAASPALQQTLSATFLSDGYVYVPGTTANANDPYSLTRVRVSAATWETCDGLDNDCDGAIDEDFTNLGVACDGSDTDLCANGTWTCRADGTGTQCVNESVVNIAEVCNHVDDDCDGSVDEGFSVGAACEGADVDSCNEGGARFCTADGAGTFCGDGPVGLWAFSKPPGTVAKDVSGWNNHGTINGAVWDAAQGGLYFNGTSAWVSVPGSASLQAPNGYTVEAWIKPQPAATTWTGVVGQVGSAGYRSYHMWLGTANTASSTIHHTYGCPSSANHAMDSGAFVNNGATWTHIVMTMDPFGQQRTYVNGALSATTAACGANLGGSTTQPVIIGRDLDGAAANWFKGWVKQVAIYDYPIAAGAVSTHYASGVPATERNFERCDGLDNDCRNGIDDGHGLGGACDAGDPDGCTDGNQVCHADGWAATCQELGPSTWLALDEGASAVAHDMTGNGHNGTVTGAAWTTTAKVGNALYFDGSGDYVEHPTAGMNGTAGTIAMWVRPGFNGTDAPAYGLYQTNAGVNAPGWISLFKWSGNIFYFRMVPSGGCCPNDLTFAPGAAFTVGTWVHVAATWNQADDSMRIYINGAQVASRTSVTWAMPALPALARVGVGHDTWFRGEMDEVVTYPYALSGAELLALKNTGVEARYESFESCDAADNDCDGAVDEGYDKAACTAGVGGCANSGTKVCSGGGFTTACNVTGKPSGTACTDGGACTKNDACTGGSGSSCAGTPYTCNDGLACTTDSCNGDGTCTFAIQANYCVIGGACVASGAMNGQCQTCNPAVSKTAWSNLANGTSCNADSNGCTQNDACSTGVCVAGAAPSCADAYSCTTDACSSTGANTYACTHSVNSGACLISGVCYTSGTTNPANQCQQCTSATTNVTTWSSKANGTACNADSNGCTQNDACSSGACVAGTTMTCNDSKTCTTDSCGSTGTNTYACTNTVNSGSCLISGTCYTNGTANPANQCQQCTSATTNVTTWSSKANGTSCNADSNGCTVADACSSGACVAGAPPGCSDGLACTNDSCASTGATTFSCVHAIQASRCVVDEICYTDGQGSPLNQCERCWSAASKTAFTPKPDGTACDDATGCTSPDTCVTGACTGAPALALGQVCDGPDADPCLDGHMICSGTSVVCADDGVALHLKMSEGSGITAADWSGNTHDGTLTGGTAWVQGPVGRAVSFDGVDDRIEVAHATALLPADGVTVALWVNPAAGLDCDAANNWRWLVSKGGFESWNVIFEQNYSIGWTARVGGVSERLWSGTMPAAQWTHVAFTYDTTTGAQRAYINGALSTQRTGSVGMIDQGTSPLRVGGWTSTTACPAGDGPFKGSVDEVVVVHRALDAAAVSALAKGGPPAALSNREECDGTDNDCDGLTDEGFANIGQACDTAADADLCTDMVRACDTEGTAVVCSDGPLSAWTFPEGTGALAKDSGAGGRDLTLVGGTVWAGGQQGTALSFDGVDDYAWSPAWGVFTGQQQLTISVWIRPVAAIGEQAIVSSSGHNDAGGCCWRWRLWRDSARKIHFALYDGDNSEIVTDAVVADNAWTHVVATVRVGGVDRLFVNGQPSGGSSTVVSNSGFGYLHVGANLWTGVPAAPFKGQIDELSIHGSELTPAQVQWLFAQGRVPLAQVNYEYCDGLDNDCRNGADDGHLFGPCDGPDSDLCSNGTLGCRADLLSTVCGTEVPANIVEACNGADDDCDGQTDESWPSLGQACDGADSDQCQNGVLVCNTTQNGVTCGPESPANIVEACNAVDDDCDGQTDEGFPKGQACDGPDSDLCAYGTYTCKANGTAVECVNESPTNVVESCNLLDDDCDGQVDEGFDKSACTMGTGPCALSGVGVCKADGTGTVCNVTGKPAGTTCTDGNACTKTDVCTGGDASSCAGVAYTCSDGLSCTTDACNGDGTCTFTPNAGSCVIGGACYTDGTLEPGNTCRRCVAAQSQTAWTNELSGTACNADNDGCTFRDRCQSGACQSGATPSCSDGISCTTDVCVSAGASTYTCSHSVLGGACLVGNIVNVEGTAWQATSGTCSGTASAAPLGLTCDGGCGSGCTSTSRLDYALTTEPGRAYDVVVKLADYKHNCANLIQVGFRVDGVLVATFVGAGIDDWAYPKVSFTATATTTTFGVALLNDACCACSGTCSTTCAALAGDMNLYVDDLSVVETTTGPCWVDGDLRPGNVCQRCAPISSQTAWSARPDGTTCDYDGSGCTVGDACASGGCAAGPAPDCGDGLGCTADACLSTGATSHSCTHPLIAGSCLIDGACWSNGDTNPANQCQRCEAATVATAWTSKVNGTACNDGDACTGPDTCTAAVCGGPVIPIIGSACEGSDADLCNDGRVICKPDRSGTMCSNGAAVALSFDEGAGVTSLDLTGNGHDGALQGATLGWGAGVRDGAVDFQFPLAQPGGTTTTRVRIAATDITGSQLTFAAWVHPTVDGSRYIMSRTSALSSRGLEISTYGTISFAGAQIWLGSSSNVMRAPLDAWTHIAVTWDGALLRAYKNGTLQRSQPIAGVAAIPWNSDIALGQDMDCANGCYDGAQAFAGRMDEAIWFQHALSQAEIVALMGGLPAIDVNHELCDDLDNDCDGQTDEGWAGLGATCDGDDADLCTDGTVVCHASRREMTCRNDGPAGAWDFREQTGSAAHDVSGNGNTATLQAGATWAPAGGRLAVDLDGAAGAVQAPDSATLAVAGPVTVEAWVRIDALPPPAWGFAGVVSKGDNPRNYSLYVRSDGYLHFSTAGQSTTCGSASSLKVPVGQWVHLAVVNRGPEAQRHEYYIDGAPAGVTAFATPGCVFPVPLSASPVLIGRTPEPNRWLDGQVDAVAIWPRALSPVEIMQHAASGVPAVAQNEEACDGTDNDCDGQTDEPWTALGALCDGADTDLCANGTVICAVNAWATDCGPEMPSDIVELCNGIDDDCDGATDELFPLVGAACDGADSDLCTYGTWTCKANGSGVECVNESPTNVAETCNGIDDDCDGPVDETFPTKGQACDGADSDLCAYGTWTCKANGSGVECTNESPSNVVEACNGADDDCDGQTDESWPDKGDPCDGADADLCKNGAWTCKANGSGLECATESVTNIPELCNATDDDCDGQTDEGFPKGQACDGADSDLCAYGTWTCKSNGSGVECINESPSGVVETCNGTDDDCDGVIDDGFVVQGQPIGGPCDGVGACGLGTVECRTLALAACSTEPGGSGDQASAELCNGADDDCDGQTDEASSGVPLTQACYTGPPGTQGTGLCHGGTATCAGGLYGACQGQVVPAAKDLVCDGKDEDCDGSTDEDYVKLACGVGACANQSKCVAGAVVPCAPLAKTGDDTDCDGIDNDCNGLADDHFAPTTYGLGVCACQSTCTSGTEQPCIPSAPPLLQDFTCNGQDDDCDGATDESYSDFIGCTIDVCVAGEGTSTPDHAACDDGNPCTGDACSVAANGCTHTPDDTNAPDPAMADGNPCTDLVCASGLSINEPNDANVPDDGLWCTVDACLDGVASHSLEADACFIDGACFATGSLDPTDGCAVCTPGTSQSEWSNVVLSVGFDDGGLGGLTTTTIAGPLEWHVDTTRATTMPASLYFGSPIDHTYAVGQRVAAEVSTGDLALAGGVVHALRFDLWLDTERFTASPDYDVLTVDVMVDPDGAALRTTVWDSTTTLAGSTDGLFVPIMVDLGAFAGQTVRVVLRFDSGDGAFNDYEGAYVDSLRVTTACCSDAADCDDGDACTTETCAVGMCHVVHTCEPSCIPTPNSVVVLLDRSSTMGAVLPGDSMSKWDNATDALGLTVAAYEDLMNLGLDTFPANGVCTTSPGLDVGFHATAEQIVLHLAMLAPAGSTPTFMALDQARVALDQTDWDGTSTVVLVTDGGGGCGGDPVTAVQSLSAMGINVLVVGYGVPPGDVATLNAMALAGGLPRPASAPGGAHYLRANTAGELLDQLDAALAVVTGERCNGEDDDCDGEVDDHVEPIACNPACSGGGKSSCAMGVWGPCSVVPTTEVCNGKDDDCDGLTDEGWTPDSLGHSLGGLCSRGVGACLAWGNWICNAASPSGPAVCSAPVVPPTPEVCDTVDNNCNGITNDGISHSCSTACGTGTEICDATGQWVGCDAPPVLEETCNAKDDDCDGVTDEGAGGQPLQRACTTVCGAGVETCTSGVFQGCTAQVPLPEQCNDDDDDCDGLIDEGPLGGVLLAACYDGPPGSETNGGCHPGLRSCLPGGAWSACEGQAVPVPEACNGADDDCDGVVDEDAAGLALSEPCNDTTGVGVCVTGLRFCTGGAWDECVGSVTPQPETCDGLDNDCDGQVDEAAGATFCKGTPGCYAGQCKCGKDFFGNYKCFLD